MDGVTLTLEHSCKISLYMIVPAVMIGQHQSKLSFTEMCRMSVYLHTRVIYIV